MIRAPRLSNLGKRLRNREERGAALVEFAIAIPIFIGLIAIIFDAGLGYSAARSSSSAARSAARIGALAGDARSADFRVLDALRAQYGDGDAVQTIKIYRTDATSNPSGKPPVACNSTTFCNEYNGTFLATLNEADFTSTGTGAAETCNAGAPDAGWCPLGRRAADGKYLGVWIKSSSKPTIGAISPDAFNIEDRAVFALYFPPAATAPTATPGPSN